MGAEAAGADDQPRAPGPAAELEARGSVARASRAPPPIAATTSTRWPVRSPRPPAPRGNDLAVERDGDAASGLDPAASAASRTVAPSASSRSVR